MPSGKAHHLMTYGLLTVSIPLVCYNPLIGLAVCAGIGMGRDINPDLDLHVPLYLRFLGYDLYKMAISHRKGLRGKDWRKLPTNPLGWLTYSHMPYLGTLLRFLPVLILWLILANALSLSTYTTWVVALAVFNGLGLNDTIHVIADLVVSEVHHIWGVR